MVKTLQIHLTPQIHHLTAETMELRMFKEKSSLNTKSVTTYRIMKKPVTMLSNSMLTIQVYLYKMFLWDSRKLEILPGGRVFSNNYSNDEKNYKKITKKL